jgi:Zn-dependent protease
MPEIVLSAIAVLIILTIHEYSHGYVAYKLGDNTARNLGRLTLNPLRHLDPFGAICMIFFRFGWAKPVPVNPRNFKNPKRDFALVALAGPLSNMIFALISSFLYLLLYAIFKDIRVQSQFLLSILQNTLNFVYIFHAINIGLGLFNLIPLPPLDGSRILNVILPARIYFKIMRYERQIYFGLILWLLGGNYISAALLSVPFIASSTILSFFARLFSLSGLLGNLFELVSDGMMSLWRLIPFLNN